MTRRFAWIMFAACAVLVAGPSSARAAGPEQIVFKQVTAPFQAFAVEKRGGRVLFEGMLHQTSNWQRRVLRPPKGAPKGKGLLNIVIVDINKQEVWSAYPSEGYYLKSKWSGRFCGIPVVRGIDLYCTKWQGVRVGRENANGVEANKYAIAANVSGFEIKGHVWVESHGIIVRFIGEVANKGGRSTVALNLRRLKVAPINGKLFKVPPPGLKAFGQARQKRPR